MTLAVVAAIICRENKEVLIAERPAGKSWAGFWEFPGGKVEAGEEHLCALTRELTEELGIDLRAETFIHFHHSQRENDLVIDFYWCDLQNPIYPVGLEGQRWQWLAINQLQTLLFPPLNQPVINKLLDQKIAPNKPLN